MNIILVGPPGTGKGTQAKLIEKEFGFKHISAGDLLREEVKNNTELGQKAAPIMRAGKLVDDELVAQIISSNVQKHVEKGFVLDGFPRNLKQAKILEKMFEQIKIEIDMVLFIESSNEQIIKRLSSRRQCMVCNEIYGLNRFPKIEGKCDKDNSELVQREDDRPEVIRERLRLYHESADPLIEFYNEKNLVTPIGGNKDVPGVFEQIKEKIKEKLR